jgi:hypothetical protein
MTGQLVLFGNSDLPPAAPDRCLDCNTDDVLYMVSDEVWLEAHPADAGRLCLGCLEERLGRRLAPSDFTAVPVNDPDRHSGLLRARLLGEAA